MPGSLGVEAMFEMLQAFALQQDMGARFERPRFQQVCGETRWKYRGQITPRESRMSVDLHVRAIDQTSQYVQLEAEGNVYKDGLRIYEVKGIRLRIVPADVEA
jgi:3-hydroxymyristoyl/3-hydroxydecanoyl-(acyl carrier protein) dehydratase